VQADAERSDYDVGPGLVIHYAKGVVVQAPPQVSISIVGGSLSPGLLGAVSKSVPSTHPC
jgi:hypothetical protein